MYFKWVFRYTYKGFLKTVNSLKDNILPDVIIVVVRGIRRFGCKKYVSLSQQPLLLNPNSGMLINGDLNAAPVAFVMMKPLPIADKN